MHPRTIAILAAAVCLSLAAAPLDSKDITDEFEPTPQATQVVDDGTVSPCEYFSGCGVLAPGPQSCTLLHTDSGEAYAVRNIGDYFPGDYVHVTGWILPHAMPCWPATVPALRVKTIGPCFSGSGWLSHGPQECSIYFVSDDGEAFVLDDYGDFWWSDRVYVTGRINEDSLHCYPALVPAIEDNTIQRVFEGCGILDRGPQNCIVRFIADEGRAYVLDDYGDFWWGDEVFVRGVVDENSWACWPAVTPAIEMNIIMPCPIALPLDEKIEKQTDAADSSAVPDAH